MKQQFVNRRLSGYHKLAIEIKSNEDFIASAALAIEYSRRTSQTPSTQKMIQFDCVAACFVDGSELWIASNSHSLTQNDVDVLCDVMDLDSSISIYIVVNGIKNDMHAEMQLLKELLDSDMNPNELVFGVSKPCCEQCASMLDTYKVGYTFYHNSTVINWQSPLD